VTDESFDIVIVGGGMVGATLAAAIAMAPACQALRIALVDATSHNGQNENLAKSDAFDSRVVALAERSRELLQAIGVWQEILDQRACAYREMQVWDGEGTGRIAFHADDIHASELGHIVENTCIVRSLYQRLRALPAVSLIENTHVKTISLSNGIYSLGLESSAATTSAGNLYTRLLIGADGATSRVRDWAKLPVREWDYGHTAIVATVKTAQPHGYTCWQRFTSEGPLAFLPLQVDTVGMPDEYHCSLVWSATTSLADELMALDGVAFCQRLEMAFEARLGSIERVSERKAIPLRQRHAQDYYRPQLALVGDAAHTIHPLAGQGVNLGFYDVAALADEVARACARGVPLEDESILKRYQRIRKSHNLSAMLAMEGFKRLFSSDDLRVSWFRNTGMKFMDNQLFLKKHLTKIARGL